ncbi:MAG: alpha-2-macroglobulin [Chitinophagaceae bacterium]|nr:MAG: alpha-2-macroglobulin [Chitinophagaceae bacterium]
MKNIWLLTLLTIFIINSFNVSAQSNDYPSEWKRVADFDKKGLTQSALAEVVKIFDAANKAGNEAQQIKAAMYQMKYRNMVEEDNRENNVFFLDTLIARTKAPARNILQSMQAELFNSYKQQNRWKFYNRSPLTEEKSKDISTWSIEKLVSTTAALYKASLQDDAILKTTKLDGLDAILQEGKNTRQLRPTLYDFLAHRALDFFMDAENDITQPAYKFILNDERIFSPVAQFINAGFPTADTSSQYHHALTLLQAVLKFHLNDANKDALLDADLKRLQFANEHGVFSNKAKLYEQALLDIEKTYSSSNYAGMAKYLRAIELQRKGERYNPITHKDNQFDLIKAKDLLLEVVKNYPKSEAAVLSQNLLNQLNQPALSLETEKVNIPGEAFRSLVKYKNAANVYLRAIRIDRKEMKELEMQGYDKLWPALTRLKAIREWKQSLPETKDLQEHSVEIKIDGLEQGTYLILASLQPGFELSGNIMARQTTYVSNISYIYNNHKELYVLNRTTGEPLAKATVQVWEDKYDYDIRKYVPVKKEMLTTDKNGFAKVSIPNNRYSNFFQVSYGKDELFTNDNYYSYGYNSYSKKSQRRTFLFTDRSIYRPGQTMFFKGIVVSTDSSGRRSEIIPGFKTKMNLFDVNGQKVSTIELTSNAYGSFNGSFKLPETGLTGQFYIQDEVNKNNSYFSVEEYKRPKFLVEVYPIWFGWGYKIWPPYGNQEEMEITNGVAKTDADGNFSISFKAIPDETVDKKNQPIFDYEVSANITDINGETRSGQTLVAVAYQALQLNIDAADKIPADSINTIKIGSVNMNGLFEKSTVELSIFGLQEPGRIFRSRYWEMPDQFVMSKEEYYRYFPYDAYADEGQVSKWAIGPKVFERRDTTTANGNFNFGQKALAPGWYKMVVITRDNYNEEVRAEKYIRLTDSKENKIDEPILLVLDKKIAAPQEKISYHIQTGFDKIWLIQSLARTGKDRVTQYFDIAGGKAIANQITATEDDRGGINISYAFVRHNRLYSGSEFVNIPWSNKDLNISYSSFRDKLLPGAEEKWTMKISGSKGEKAAAELLVSMYDASLDQFKAHNWNPLSSIWPGNTELMEWTGSSFAAVQSDERVGYTYPYQEPEEKVYDALADYGWNEGGYGGRVYKLRGKSDMATVEVAAAAPVANQRETKSSAKVKNQAGAEESDGMPFTMPEALTKWKLMTLAHSKELASAYSEQTVITQKPLMVQPNVPRFIREGDDIELVAKIVNLSEKEITGTVQLELMDAATGKSVDGWFKNIFPTQYFTVEAGKSMAIKFPFGAPHNFNSALTYRIKAISKDGSFSDGEEMVIPVLTNRMLVTETMPLNLRSSNSKTFLFDKLLQSANSNTLTQHSFTIEYSSNPAWYAVQALPYLMEYPYECAEQNFNRYYANVLAAFVANSTPKIKAVFDKWKTADTAALMSNLQKNQELKAALLEETPWVLQAKSEAEQKKNIAVLFDMVRLGREKQASLNKLKEMQSSNGGFTWFKGGPDDRYITQYIITGIGHLVKLKALTGDDLSALAAIINKALPYLDARLKEEHDALLKAKVKPGDNHLSATAIQYLYMRSFFTDKPVNANAGTAINFYKGQAQKFWLSQSKYMQGMIALAMHRSNDEKTAKAILASLKQNAIVNEELGMHWKEFTTGGYYWYQAPVESQALMIEAFSDIEADTKTVDDLKTWLLKQKQVQNWKTTKATAEAVYALLLNGSNWLGQERTVTIQTGNTTISSADVKSEAGTGYFKQVFTAEQVKPQMGNIKVTVADAPKSSPSSTWGAAYWQYFEDLDKITSAATPLQLTKKLFVEQAGDRGPVLRELKEGETLKIGDKVKVRIELKADRDMEYIHMKDMRAASMEPVNVISQYKWQGGLGYYESTRDASTNFFISWLPRGSYVFEYPMFVSHAGNFSNGITTIQSMYAPEFSSHSEGIRVRVE